MCLSSTAVFSWVGPPAGVGGEIANVADPSPFLERRRCITKNKTITAAKIAIATTATSVGVPCSIVRIAAVNAARTAATIESFFQSKPTTCKVFARSPHSLRIVENIEGMTRKEYSYPVREVNNRESFPARWHVREAPIKVLAVVK